MSLGARALDLYANRMRWTAINAQNLYTKKILAYYFPNVYFLNISYSTSFRADSHTLTPLGPVVKENAESTYTPIDCNGYCMSGPMDHWIMLFVNMIQIIDEEYKDKNSLCKLPTRGTSRPKHRGTANTTISKRPPVAISGNKNKI